jgi:HAD superfamily hydrolase (TIGR01490 family)
VEAAFFDLDKTVIARSSMMAFAPSFRREGLLKRRTLLKGAWIQLIYVRLGAGPRRLARIQESVLAVTAGWDRAAVRRLVGEGLASAIDPITYREAVGLIAEHRREGRRIVLVSAAPQEVVEPIGARLGVDGVIASLARVDGEGRYTGALERYAYGPAKAVLIRDLAGREGIDLAGSWAYTDSFTDLPMLEEVGHPVAVNPDRALQRVARMRGWDVVTFEERGYAPVLAAEAARGPGRWRAVAPASALALLATTGGVTAWWMWRRPARTA